MAGGDRKHADAALIAALAGSATVRDAAAAARVGERTVYRWPEDAEFKERVDQARAELLTGAMARLSAATTDAVTTLTGLLAAESESVRLGAARAILDGALRWRDQIELAGRLDNIEAWIEALDADSAVGKPAQWRRAG